MKYLLTIITVLLLFSCSTTKQLLLTDIHLIQGAIYCEHSELDEFTRHYYIKSEACTGYGRMMFQQAIYSIPGVSNIYPSPYRISVMICPVYSWDVIEPEIISRINRLLEAYELGQLEPAEEPGQDKSKGL